MFKLKKMCKFDPNFSTEFMLRKLLLSIFIASCAAAFAQLEELPIKVINGASFYYYEVPPKATIYSITRTYNISRDELFKYNPQVIDGLRAGDTLIFPVKLEEQLEEITEEPVDEPAEEKPVEPVEEKPEPRVIQPVIEQPAEVSEEDEGISVGVMLPFMLDAEAVTRHIQNQTAFYRGMLLAVNDLASKEEPLTLRAYDTEGSLETLKQILSKPEVQSLDYIIAPGDSLSIEMIAETADTTGATVLNLFAVKNPAHLTHESVFQGNIPHDAMYVRAIEAYCNLAEGKKVLILNATDIPADKRAFTEEFADLLLKNGIPYEQINYSGKLTDEDLHSLEAREYLCIPTSSSREALMKILPALSDFADSSDDMEVALLGYPEWVVIRGEVKEKLHKLTATVYSRFSTDLDGADVKRVNAEYQRWYGEAPQQSLPDVMLLGYDTMAWLINGLDKPYIGLQNSYKAKELRDAGLVNEGLYLINFTRDGRVDAQAL